MDLLPAMITALGLGIWTAVQPCPMATNVAAISYLGRRVDSPERVLLAGLLYATGRALTYVVLALLLVESFQASRASIFLQAHVRQLVGPVLVVLGMFFLGLMGTGWSGPGVGEKMQKRVDALGVWGALVLGILFALAFCPVSAACFFGSLFALLASNDSRIVLPSVYGVGTALPVVALAALVALGVQAVGRAVDRLARIIWWAQRAAGFVCLLIGIYLSLKYVFELPLF
jgi:cytochrome c-type biogenesis protein